MERHQQTYVRDERTVRREILRAAGLKFCSGCEKEKPFDAFNRDPSRIDGVAGGKCKECKSNPSADYLQRMALLAEGKKRCSTCHVAKPFAAFYSDPHGSRGVHARCKECCRTWLHTNRERVNELQRARYASLDPEERRLINARANGARKKGVATVEPVDFAAILERDGHVCHICSREVEPSDIHFDHVIPLARGGAHSMENIRVAHSLCNLRKGTKMVEEMAVEDLSLVGYFVNAKGVLSL